MKEVKKNISFNDTPEKESSKKILAGITILNNAVKSTLGPKGHNVMLDMGENSDPILTKDGVTVAKEIFAKDPIENNAIKLVKSVAIKTSEESGDGTTTATILTHAIYELGIQKISVNSNPILFKKGIEAAVKHTIAELNKRKVAISNDDEIKNIATISANNDPVIGGLIAEAIKKVTKDGAILIDDSKTMETFNEYQRGFQVDRGSLTPYLNTDFEKDLCNYSGPVKVILYMHKIETMPEVMHILEYVNKTTSPFLLIAEDFGPEVLSTLVTNKMRGALKPLLIQLPGFGDKSEAIMEDIATLSGATVISKQRGDDLSKVKPEEVIGEVADVTIFRNKTVIVAGETHNAAIKDRISQLKTQEQNAKPGYDKQSFKDRYTRLTGEIATIKVGGSSKVEVSQTKDRVDDAVKATLAAIEEGIVPGGGVAFAKIAKTLETIKTDNNDFNTGVDIVKEALKRPLNQIAVNSGDPSVVNSVTNNETFEYGFNANTEEYGNMYDIGVIDPVKVSRIALQNAASTAAMLLTTNCVVTIIPEKKDSDDKRRGPGGQSMDDEGMY